MKRLLFIIKIIFSVLFLLGTFFICYLLFFAPKKKRFSFAEQTQGQYLSQKTFDILIFQNPNYSDAYFEKSVAFNKRGDYAKGFELLNEAVELKPKLHLGYRGWLKYHKVKDYQGSIDDLKRLDSLTPNFVDAPWGDNIHYVLGLSYKGLKQYKIALDEFDRSIETEKDSSWVNPYVFLYKGIIYNKLEKYEVAIKNLNVYLKQNYNNSPEAYFHKGIAFKKLNDLDSSKVCFKKSIELFNKGYKIKDIYNEVQDELYLSDIIEELKYFNE
ncbi:tetratricopeptide repeat protein [Cellulophaga omnivescoria]|uniref:tetratricopeptide repeat protein n=1 Tax=Cellulophaga omnivescoria TaxID=1888890 RepID=UPI000984E752|nr:hypothetical protein [Cellulophaga omnivescoria]